MTAASQDGEIFVTWGNAWLGEHRVKWKESAGTNWDEVTVRSRWTRSLAGLQNGVPYTVQVEALDGARVVSRSHLVTATPHPRNKCVWSPYLTWDLSTSYFCSKPAFDAWLAGNHVDPRTLRCRNQPVTTWDADVPDCLYTTADGAHRMLLLRSGDNVFADHPYPDPAASREEARRQIWAADNPFSRNDSGLLAPQAEGGAGKVTKHAGVQLFRIATSDRMASRVTWFLPKCGIHNRYAIYSEGHGGAAVEVGAVTIDWLLERGWQVIAVDMPLTGLNQEDKTADLQIHPDLYRLDEGVTSPLSLFLLPMKTIVDSIASRSTVDPEILLIGFSGGGWTSYLYGATDPRVDVAVQAAGGRPNSQRLDGPWEASELGDYEQTSPFLFARVPHEDLMVAAGARGSLHLFNQWDTCCFRVQPGDPFVKYLEGSSAALHKKVRVFVDETNRNHSIGAAGYEVIGRYLDEVMPPVKTTDPRPCAELTLPE
ncbi:MAG: hypothetical protein M3P06_14305 [Acidobacteriota bacterium]|nr:hypothetical protein [Acidobacteriota bacterium]